LCLRKTTTLPVKLRTLYFYTASIVNWKPLLKFDKYKNIIIDSLKYLAEHNKVSVYGFVIMPNHIHLIWELLEMNGKESPHASFMKFTSHKILQELRTNHPDVLERFEVEQISRKHQFWQRDAFATELYTPNIIYQKLDYFHNNPVHGKWMLSGSPIDYKYSSARFYETWVDEFGLIKHIGERL